MFLFNYILGMSLTSAISSNQRNWRYHKKHQIWLTKDDMMVPQALGNGQERGYYIFFDIRQWQRQRVRLSLPPLSHSLIHSQREFTLVYDDLETIPTIPRNGMA